MEEIKELENKFLQVTCKYCGFAQFYKHKLEKAEDWITLDDALEFDNEYICNRCGCLVRLNEALEKELLKKYGYV